VARHLLELWEVSIEHFRKVVPIDYKKVLEAKHLDEEQMRVASV
jgi:glutamate synthase domain-containing protein 3